MLKVSTHLKLVTLTKTLEFQNFGSCLTAAFSFSAVTKGLLSNLDSTYPAENQHTPQTYDLN